MCGFAGLIRWDRALQTEDRHLLARMTRVLAHRGPDDEGYYVGDHAGLGFRRLAIIDLGGGHQPLSNEDGSLWIVFNGEIYNYLELRAWLCQRGHQFRTDSDTETIVHLYEELGVRCAEKLRGMFAFAIWDVRKRELYIARDRVGKKPLYYASGNGSFWFGSEIKALLQDPAISLDIDPEAIDAYLAFSYVPSPKTGFEQIHKLPGGHWLHVRPDHLELREYWDWHFTDEPAPDLSPAAEARHTRELRSLLEDSVQVRLMSEVPLGAFLSGGIDSSTIVALMAPLMREPVRTTSIGFDYERYDELPHAQRIADQFHTDHLAHVVRADASSVLERIVWHLDEPFGDPSVIPTYYLAKLTRERVTVALSGDGGDEVFAGYDFRYLPTRAEMRLRRMLPVSTLSPLFRLLAAIYPRGRRVPRPLRLKTILRNLSVTAELAQAYDISFIAPDLRDDLYTPEFTSELAGFSPEELVLAVFRKSTAHHWLNRALYVDAKFYMQNDVLTKVDRMSMANSLEVRSPLLDQRVMELMAATPAAFKLKGTRCKHILKEAMKDRLAPDLLDRSKQGFSIPLAEWLRGGLRDYAADLLLDPHAFSRRFVRSPALRRLWDLHQTGEDYGSELWNLLMLELWGTVYLKHAREAPSGAATAAQPLFSPNTAVRRPVEAGMTQGCR